MFDRIHYMGLPPELVFVFGDAPTVFQSTRLVAREIVAENTLALTIERPEGFTFEPGQNTTISIPGKHADDLREFTIASAPYEKDLVIAMRIRNSNFKNTIYALRPGDAISIRSAAGSLWEASTEPQVWISGGIGITPFRSVIRHLLHTHVPLSVTHFHSDHTRATAPFLSEFESYAAEQQGFNFYLTTTREKPAGRLHGRITGEMIATHVAEYARSRYFVVGTDSFLSSMRTVLSELGVPLAQIRVERFEGYKKAS